MIRSMHEQFRMDSPTPMNPHFHTFLLAAVASVLTLGALANADQPTFTRDIAPVLHDNCVQCHRPGEIAPMSLLTYEEARPWGKSIKKNVASRAMPPWKADPAHGTFSNDMSLTDQQIDTIIRWVDSGMPLGDQADMPNLPEFTEGWQMGQPDYIVSLPPVDVAAEGPDTFPNLDVVLDIPENRWLRAVEVRPGNREVVHHLVAFTDSGFGGAAIPDFLAVWAVGTPPQTYPEGMGRRLGKQATLRTNMHYHTNGVAVTDETRFGLYFGEGELQKEVNGQFSGTVNFKIPAYASDHKLTARSIIDQDIQIVSFFPHMHTRGRSMRYTATYPDGRTETLLNVPQYDFNWQWFYYPAEPVLLPEGTVLDVEAHYDNSAANPNNPDPSVDLVFGESTYAEMMFGVFEFVPVDGVKPTPANPARKIQQMLATYPPENAYNVQVDLGLIRLASGFILPPDGGDGIWYFPFGRELFDLPMRNVSWEGDSFSASVSLLGQEGITMMGTVSPEGAIAGTFDVSEFDFTQLSGASAGEGAPSIEPRGFEGVRVSTRD